MGSITTKAANKFGEELIRSFKKLCFGPSRCALLDSMKTQYVRYFIFGITFL